MGLFEVVWKGILEILFKTRVACTYGGTLVAVCQTYCKTKANLSYIYSPYRAVNTLRLCYTNQSVNAV
jgi:hypothetical protein